MTDPGPLRILAFSGSARKASINQRLVAAGEAFDESGQLGREPDIALVGSVVDALLAARPAPANVSEGQ